MKKMISALLILLYSFPSIAQERIPYEASESDRLLDLVFFPGEPFTEKAPGTKVVISGYVKWDGFWDTRQVEATPGGQSLFFPKRPCFDPVGQDINAQGQFNFLAIESRLRFNVQGPEILGAESSAVIETDFLGIESVAESVKRLRLRHAFTLLKWTNSEKQITFLAGQYWHPLFVPAVTPQTISFDSGVPEALNSRNPELNFQLVHHKWLTILFGVGNQGNSLSDGPKGFDLEYSENGIMPFIAGRIEAQYEGKHYVGFGANVQRIKPRLCSEKGFKVSEAFVSYGGTFYIAFFWKHFAARTKVNAGQNMTNFDMLGGYAVSDINPITGERTYTNIRSLGWWFECMARDYWVEPGLFVGYARNFGAGKPIICSITDEHGCEKCLIFSRGKDINDVERISPRVRFNFKNLTFAAEITWIRAGYGQITPTGSVEVTDPTHVVRTLFSVYYFF